MAHGRHFYLLHLWFPLGLFIFLAGTIQINQTDLALADLLYKLEGNCWTLQHHWLTYDLIHEGGRMLVAVMGVLVLGATVVSLLPTRARPYRRGLIYLTLSLTVASVLIGVGKQLTHIDCPWALARYGGTNPYLGLFDSAQGIHEVGACFPSGHAGAGYTWFALYFFARHSAPRWQTIGLIIPAVLGLLFGIAQQLRGAHFLSHDLWAATICWLTAFGFYRILLRPDKTTSD